MVAKEENQEELSNVFGNEAPKTTEEEREENQNSTSEEVSNEEEDDSTEAENESQKKTYTQAEVDAMMARVRKKYSKSSSEEEAVSEETPSDNVVELSEEVSEEAESFDPRYAKAEMKAFMATSGEIDPKKVQRAINLINLDKIMAFGEFNEQQAKNELEELLKDWPELKTTGTESNSFYFGAKEQEERTEDKQKGAIARIFGN